MSSGAIVTVVILTVTAVASGVLCVWLFRHLRGLRDPVFTGDPVPGTAQITSLRRTSSVFSTKDKTDHVQYEFALRVRLPGQAPYDTTIRQAVDQRHVDMSEFYGHPDRSDGRKLQPGTTVVVAADSADPQVVRIDLTQPITPGDPARP